MGTPAWSTSPTAGSRRVPGLQSDLDGQVLIRVEVTAARRGVAPGAEAAQCFS